MSGRVVRLDPAAHKVADALLPWFVNGTLDADERTLVEQHLTECARCRDEVEWLRELHAACAAGEASTDGSSAFHKLRVKLETPRERFPVQGKARGAWRFTRPWTHWVIGAQLALIAGLSVSWLQSDDHAGRYGTLGAPSVASQASGSVVVVFDPKASEAELRRVLRSVEARVVDGPTRSNAYVLEVPAAHREEAMRSLRAEPAVAFAEELDRGNGR
jgi:anti-sigma factor RsiW